MQFFQSVLMFATVAFGAGKVPFPLPNVSRSQAGEVYASPTAIPTQAPVHTSTVGPFSLRVVSPYNQTLDGTFLDAMHEGAGMNYVFAAAIQPNNLFQLNGTVLTTSYSFGYPTGALLLSEQHYKPFLEIGVLDEPGTGRFQQGYGIDQTAQFTVNGTATGWYACNDSYDPYRYPYPAIMFFKQTGSTGGLQCEPISLVATFYY